MKKILTKKVKIGILIVLALTISHAITSNETLQVTFPKNENCVAYKTNKSMIFQDSVDVVGLNCQIKVSTTNNNGKIKVKASIPLLGFDSNSKGRDDFVREFLKEKIKPNLEFTSREYTNSELSRFINQSAAPKNLFIDGHMTIGDDSFPVRFELQKSDGGLTGLMVTSFSYFHLQPPVAGPFGAVANVQDYLELHLQVKYDFLN